eukprot:TRINITY_DN424_c0_g1_i4.p1 TRINITY_DN424_c0_g1~~TRINITY_DN424_c0_g1_i4.p1  ORF type:complete len:491 (-),score=136.85 TRINITY_DN424_c0_g1_i4:775-2079(-)
MGYNLVDPPERPPPKPLKWKVFLVLVTWIHKYALQVEGVFRMSGEHAGVEDLRYSFDTDNDLIIPPDENPHNVTGALKLYLREVEEPLITGDTYHEFLQAGQLSDQAYVNAVIPLIQRLPYEHRCIIIYLAWLMREIVALEPINKMGVGNLAIVFGPTIARDPDPNAFGFAGISDQAQLVGKFINQFDEIFGSNAKEQLLAQNEKLINEMNNANPWINNSRNSFSIPPPTSLPPPVGSPPSDPPPPADLPPSANLPFGSPPSDPPPPADLPPSANLPPPVGSPPFGSPPSDPPPPFGSPPSDPPPPFGSPPPADLPPSANLPPPADLPPSVEESESKPVDSVVSRSSASSISTGSLSRSKSKRHRKKEEKAKKKDDKTYGKITKQICSNLNEDIAQQFVQVLQDDLGYREYLATLNPKKLQKLLSTLASGYIDK